MTASQRKTTALSNFMGEHLPAEKMQRATTTDVEQLPVPGKVFR